MTPAERFRCEVYALAVAYGAPRVRQGGRVYLEPPDGYAAALARRRLGLPTPAKADPAGARGEEAWPVAVLDRGGVPDPYATALARRRLRGAR
jgi:hypothetical protein